MAFSYTLPLTRICSNIQSSMFYIKKGNFFSIDNGKCVLVQVTCFTLLRGLFCSGFFFSFFCWWMINMKCEFFTSSFPKFLWQWLAASEARAVCIWPTIQSHGSKQALVSLSVWALSALLLFRACLQLRTELGTLAHLTSFLGQRMRGVRAQRRSTSEHPGHWPPSCWELDLEEWRSEPSFYLFLNLD